MEISHNNIATSATLTNKKEELLEASLNASADIKFIMLDSERNDS